MSKIKRLFRSINDRKLGGVCGGLGAYLNVDSTIIRLIFIVMIMFSAGLGLIAYLLMWVVIPEQPTRGGRIIDEESYD